MNTHDSWSEAISAVILLASAIVITTGIGALIGWALWRADIAAVIGASIGMLGWITLGYQIAKDSK